MLRLSFSHFWPVFNVGGRAEHGSSAQVPQTSIFSAISMASSISIPRYRTVLSIFEWPNKSCTARRLPVRRWISVASVRRRECVPNLSGSRPMLATHWEGERIDAS